MASKIRALGKPADYKAFVLNLSDGEIAPVAECQQDKQEKRTHDIWCDKDHAWYQLAIDGNFQELKEEMEQEKTYYNHALNEVKRLWSLSKPVDDACDLPVCINACGLYSMWGLDGHCQQCWIFEKKGRINVNLDIVIDNIRLNPFAVLDHVASASGLMHGDELDACVALLRKHAPKDTFLAMTDEWTTMQNHDFVKNLRYTVGARRRICGAKRSLYPFNVSNSHWELALVDVDSRTVSVYDSLRIHADLSKFKNALSAIHDISDWTILFPACGKQVDSVSCGLFVVHHMKLLMLNMAVTGSNVPSTSRKACERDTQTVRSQIARELLLHRLDGTIVLADTRYQ